MATTTNKTKATRFLNKVGTFVAEDPSTGQVMFDGVFNSQTNVEITMAAQDTKGGIGNALLMREYTDRMVQVTLTTKDWNLEYVAASVGSKIEPGLAEIYDIEVPVNIDNLGKGTLPKVAVGIVNVKLPDGTKYDVQADSDNIIDLSPYSISDTCAKCTYRFSAKADTIIITADKSPMIVHLYLQSGVSDTMKGLIGHVLVEIPSFALDGNISINTNADGTATEIQLVGVALAVDGSECKEGAVYGYVREAIEDYKAPEIIAIVASPSPMQLAMTPAPETQTISVIGERGVMYSTVGIAASELTFLSDTPATATVNASGIVTAVATGSATITVTYAATTGNLTDEVDVTVVA
jgi:hypothetical protein